MGKAWLSGSELLSESINVGEEGVSVRGGEGNLAAREAGRGTG